MTFRTFLSNSKRFCRRLVPAPFRCKVSEETGPEYPPSQRAAHVAHERTGLVQESGAFSSPEERKAGPNTTADSPEVSRGTNWKHVGSTALNTLVFALQNVGRAPVPGIDMAVGAVLDSIEHGKAIPANSQGVKDLSERMTLLATFVEKINLENEEAESISRRLISELKSLSADIDTASTEGAIAKFFNSVQTSTLLAKHDQTIDSIMVDLSATISVDTNNQVKEALAKMNVGNAPIQRMDFSHADINTAMVTGDEKGGNAGYRNIGSSDYNASNSRIKTGGGHVFSENDARMR